MISALLLAVVFALLQLALVLHVRAIGIDAAGEGARRAALYGASSAEGEMRVWQMLQMGAPGVRVSKVSFSKQAAPVAGRRMIVAKVRVALPLIGPWGPSAGMTLTGRSLVEEPVHVF